MEDDLFEIDYVQQADVMTFVHKNYKPSELSRFDINKWQFSEINFRASILPPSNLKATYKGSVESNTTTYSYVVCSGLKS